MRLSDIKGERTLDVIADIIDPVANLAESEAAKELFKREALPEGVSAKSFLAQRIRRVVPRLLKSNKRDLLTIMSVIADKPYEQFVEGLDLVSLTTDLVELCSDKAFAELFIRAQTGEQSGSAQESTEGR